MQYVNDDMDDVFKKAGEDYPLHTGMPDWEKVQHTLTEQNVQQPTQKRRHKKYLLLLLLLPFALICNRYVKTEFDHTGSSPHVAENKSAKNKSTGKVLTVTEENKKNKIAASSNKTSVSTNKKVAATTKKTAATDAAFSKNNFNEVTLHVAVEKKNKRFVQTKNQHGLKSHTNKPAIENADASYIQNKNLPDVPVSRVTEKANLLSLTANKLLMPLHSAYFLDAVSSAIATDALLQPKSGLSKSALHYKKGFYAGVMVSADITSVRLQKPSKLGRHYGLLAGYQFNKRWSLEAGIFSDRKHYYTKGKYFDTAHLYLPPNTDVSEVSGVCAMLELPFAIKYNFSVGNKAAWFATTGISSYIMKEEDYSYTYHYRNSGNYSVHDKTYRNATTNLFSVLQVSGGYTRYIGRSTALRLEPYLKLPLTGLGYGKLHFSSAGLNAGFVKRF